MPRGVDSDEDHELKGGRRTRATAAIATAPNTPVRRSTRNRNGSANPDGSSPESTTDSVSSNSKINTRRRAANVEPVKATKSGRNSRRASVDAGDLGHAPGTPTLRSTRRSIAVVTPVERPKPATRNTRRVKRTSESESSPLPTRVTRRTRAMSAEPEFIAQSAASNLSTTHEGTPTKTRRGRALALPKEPAVMEEVDETKSGQSVIDVSDESETSIHDQSSTRLSTIEASPKNTSRTGDISDSHVDDVEDDDKDDVRANKSPGKLSKNPVPLLEQSSDNDSLMTQKSTSPALESEPSEISMKRRSKDFIAVDNDIENVKISTAKSPMVSKSSESDKSKEVGVRIEDLLNKSIEKQQQSPGNKENEKVNVSSEKIKKNLEFDVCPARVVITRRSSNSTPLTEKYSKSKLNISLDEQALSEHSLVKTSTMLIDGDNARSRRSKTLDKKPVDEATTPDTDTESLVASPSHLSTSIGQFASDIDKEKTDHCFVKLEKLAIDHEATEDFILFDSTESIEPVNKSITGKKNQREVDDDETDRVQSNIDEEPSSRSSSSKTKLSEDENSSEQRTSEKNRKADDDEKDEAKSPSKPRRLSSRLQRLDTPNKPENKDTKCGSVFDTPPSDQTDNEKEKKNEAKSATPKEDEDYVMEEDESANEDTAEKDKPESLVDSDASSNSREKQSDSKNNGKKEKAEEKSHSPKTKRSKKNASLRASDAESDTIIDGLFQDISADEWVSKYKHCSLADAGLEFQKSGSKTSPSKSLSGDTSTSNSETCADRPFSKIPNSDANEKEKTSAQIVIDIEESDEEMVVEYAGDTPSNKRKSLNESAKSTALPAQCDQSQTDLTDHEDDSAKFSTDESNDKQKTDGKTSPVEEMEVEEKQKTPKNLETKLSNKKSTEKSRKSLSRICDNDGSSDDEVFVDVGSTKKSKTRTPASDKKTKQNTPVSKRNFLTLDCLNSDSLPSEVETVDDDYSSSAEKSKIMPSFLFNVASSDSENSEKSDADGSMNSDIARDMNLAGDLNIAYSDDDVPGDECRASESEHSDEDDDGSDLIDFVVDDDEAESSAESELSADEAEKESTAKNSYKRLLNVFTSDEEGTDEQTEERSANVSAETNTEVEVEKQITQSSKEKSNVTEEAEAEAEEDADAKEDSNEVDEEEECEEIEEIEVDEEENEEYEKVEEESEEKDEAEADTENEEAEEESNRSQNPLKTPRRSLGETDSPKVQSSTKKSKRSLELDKSQSTNSAKKQKYAKDSSLLAPLLDSDLPKSIKKLKKLHKSFDKFDITIDIATPDHCPTTPSDSNAGVAAVPSKESSSKKNKLTKLIDSHADMDATIDLTTPNPATPKLVDSKSAPVTPAPSKEIINSKKKLKKLKESYAKASATIGSEASDDDAEYLSVSKLASVGELSGPNTSIVTSSGKKKRKSVSQDDAEVLEVSTRLHDVSNASSKHYSKIKTPKSASKTNNVTPQPSSAQKTPRNISKLNKTLMTPSSETPQTKFLRKERLNESLPLIELNSRRSKTFTKSVLLHDMSENDGEEMDSDRSENDEVSKESEDKGNEANDESFNNEDEIADDGAQDDADKNGQDDRSNDENDEDKDHDEIELELEDEEEEVSEEQTKPKKKKKKSITEIVEEPDDPASKTKEKKKKSKKSKNLDAPPEPSIKKKGDKRKADLLNEDEIVPADSNIASKSRTVTSNGKDNSLENSERSKIVQKMKKSKKTSAVEAVEGEKKKVKQQKVAESDSDSDDAPESLDFVKAREDALTTMKNIATNLKVSMEAKKKKRRDQLEKIRVEKEAKLKKLTTQGKVKPESGKVTLKRLPEDVLEHLSDAPNQPQKRRKLLKGEEIIVPSKSMFSSDKVLKTQIKVDDTTGSVSSSGGTTQFNVVSIERVKKVPKKAVAVASFRDRMLARNPRQAASTSHVYQTKQKAAGKDGFARRNK